MSRNPPTNIQARLQEGSILIEWEVDSFFPDPESPDNILIELGEGGPNRSLGGDARSVELGAGELTPFAGTNLAVNIGFQWDGGVPEWGSIGLFIPAPGEGP